MTEPASTPPTENPDGAGTAPFDRTNLVSDAQPDVSADDETRPAVGPGPIGGEATVAASSWGGASDGEMDELRESEQHAGKPQP
jgi:hypothetical protein